MANKPTYEQLKQRVQKLEKAESVHKSNEAVAPDRKDLFHVMFEKHDAIMLIIEPDSGAILNANIPAQNYYGYSIKTLKQMKIQDINILSPQVVAEKRQQAANEELNHFVFPHRLSSGEIRTVEVHSSPAIIDGKKILFSIIHDITDRKRIVEKLRDSEERFRTIMEQSPWAIGIYDPNGKLLIVNDEWEQFWNINKSDVADFNILDDKECERTGLTSAFKETLKGNVSRIPPAKYNQKESGMTGGSIRWISSKMYPIKNQSGKIKNIVLVMEDITRRKLDEKALKKAHDELEIKVEERTVELKKKINEHRQAEVALRENDERLTEAQKLAKLGHYVFDISKDCWISSPQLDDLFGIDKNYRKNVASWMKIVHPDHLETMSAYLQDNILTQHQTFDKEYKIIDQKNGQEKWVHGLGDLKFDENNNPIEMFGTIQDITEKKQLEDQLRQARKMESIGTMAGGIAHDFNNLLYMITGNAELALEDIPEWNPVHRNLKEIKSAALRAAGIVKQLLNFSRKTDQALKPIGALTVIKDALKFLRSMIPTSIEIRKHLPDTDIAILADPIQINQVLMYICSNASQVMEETGGILEITVEEETLEEDSVLNHHDLPTDEYLKITISDTGPGIAPEIIDRIFDPYFTTKAVGKGSGLGLAVVHGIVKNHNGTITVDSQPGKGSTFTILFPIIAKKPMMETKPPEEILHGNETILFVDDEESIAGMTGKMLERLGYEVETKTNPIQALELFQSNPDRFDLIITDMTMPQMSGVKLSEKMKELRSDIPVIICTGHSPLIDEEKAESIDIAGFVMKPIVTKDIAKIIRKVLDNNVQKLR